MLSQLNTFSYLAIFSYIVTAIATIAAIFAIRFAIQKIGHKILISYEIALSGIDSMPDRITNVTLINKKNKPIPVLSIWVKINNEIALNVEEFNPPLTLKGLDALYITTTPISFMALGQNIFWPDFSNNQIDLYVQTPKKLIKCKVFSKIVAFVEFSHCSQPLKSTLKFNDTTYGLNAKYAITYVINRETHTAIINDCGSIRYDWEFKYNHVPKQYMASKEGIEEFLEDANFNKIFQYCYVNELNHNQIKSKLLNYSTAQETNLETTT